MKAKLLIAAACALALPAGAQTASTTNPSSTTPPSMTPSTTTTSPGTTAPAATATEQAQSGQTAVVPDQTPADPANAVDQMGSSAGAQMQRRQATEQAAAGAATTQPGVVQGKTVQDTKGQRVGTIETIEGEYAILATSKAKVRVPKTSFADQNGVLVIALSEEQINAAASAPQGTSPTSN